MVFGFLKRKQQPARREADPLEAFDEVIEAFERQAADVRKSAATLIALRTELRRDEAKYGERLAAHREKLDRARHESAAEKTLHRDLAEAQVLLDKTTESLAQAEADAALLVEAAEELGRQLAELKAERQSAKARLSAGLTVSAALKAQVAGFGRSVRLDAARDEVERAQALADVYREDKKR